jgi:hypothetical protein
LVNDLFKKQVYVIGAVRSNSSAMPTVFKEKKRWMRENCKKKKIEVYSVIVSANTHSFILNFTDLSFINCLIPQNLCFDLIILSSTAIFSFGWKKSWETLLAWSINGCNLVNL